METDITLTSEQREKLREAYDSAREYLQKVEAAKEDFKDVVEATAERTGLEKKIVRKFFTVKFKATLDELRREVEALSFLDE